MQTGMEAPEAPVSRMWPAPTRPTRTACSAVVTPLIESAANVAHARKPSLPPAARTTMAGTTTMPGTASMADWSPSPSVTAGGARSCGS